MSICGTWQCMLGAMPIVFRFASAGDEKTTGKIDSPSTGLFDLEFDEVILDGNTVRARLERARARLELTLLSSGEEMIGKWSQAQYCQPLTVKRVDRFVGPPRPQEPTYPLPYIEEPVLFASGSVVLSGTLTRPPQDKPCPAVVLVHGSGKHNRDETIFFHKPFLLLSDFLTRRGIAVLRYDKRGAGASTGVYGESTTMDFAQDAEAAVRFLSTHEHVDGQRIGIVGHSEGGIIAPIVANRCSAVRMIVLLAGSALPGEQILLSQLYAIGKAEGLSEQVLAQRLARARSIYHIVKTEANNETASALIQAKLPPASGSADAHQEKGAEGLAVTGNWYRYFIEYDPRPALSKVKCPVLVLIGDKDLQVVLADNMPEFRAALAQNRDATFVPVAGVNHLFQTCVTGTPSEYGSIEETIAPVVLELLWQWLRSHTGLSDPV